MLFEVVLFLIFISPALRNLPYKITTEELYDIFGKYGAIRQIRLGNTNETRGTAYVVYEDIFDAKNACDHLSGFNVCNRYLIVIYYQPNKMYQKMDREKKEGEHRCSKSKIWCIWRKMTFPFYS